MKLSVLFTFMTLLTMQANDSYGQHTKITLNLENITVAGLLDEIEAKTEFRFVYKTREVDLNRKVTIKGEKEKVSSILDKIFRSTNTSYIIIDKQIFLRKSFDLKISHDKDRSYIRNIRKPQFSVIGLVTDENGEPLPGANIVEKGTTNGVTTDFDGNFSIELNDQNTILVASYIGFATKEVLVNGQTRISIQLKPDSGLLDEVVVTALGISKAEKSVGYSIQKVKGTELTEVNSGNWTNGLNGKVSGLNLVKSSSLLGSTRVILRGESSLSLDNNQALFVVDGLPISNNFASNTSKGEVSAEPDFGNGINDLNPDDIESVSVLKGPSAAALYGSRAANGVIMITTKSASKGSKGIGVNYNSTLLVDNINRWPDYQYEYGSGGVGQDLYYSYGNSEDGSSTAGSSYNWGPKFEGQKYVQFGSPLNEDGERIKIPWKAEKDNIKGFFNSGFTNIQNISIDGRNDGGNFRFSYTNLNKTGIVPNNELDRNSFSLKTGYNFNEKLTVDVVANYINSQSDNISTSGYDSVRGVMYYFIWQERNASLDWIKDYWVEGKEGTQQKQLFTFANNPYFVVNEILNGFDKNRLFGNVKVSYKLNSNFDVMVRAGTDLVYEDRTFRAPYSTLYFPFGYYKTQKINSYDNNFDFLVNYNKELSKDFKFSLSFGGNILRQYYDFQEVFAQELAIPGVYSLGNSKSRPSTTAYYTDKKVNSLYGFGQLSFRDFAFLDFTGRNDWSSTLPTDNNSYFYPSISSSFLLGNIFNMPSNEFLSFAKLRLSWAQVGNDTSPYQLEKYYNYGDFGGSVANPTKLAYSNLKPEITTSYEIGTNLRFFDNRLNLDATVYYAESKNQILDVPFDISSGFSSGIKNAGLIVNKGLEISLQAFPIRSKNGFNWSLFANWSANRNKVESFGNDIGTFLISSTPGANIEARVGEPFGNIYGKKFLRSPDGQIVYKDGIAQWTDDFQLVGNINPDWLAGIGSKFSFRNFSFDFSFNGKVGGDVISLTHGVLAASGGIKKTLPYRYEGVVGEGVKLDNNGNYVPNDVKVSAGNYWRGIYRRYNAETNTFDTSFIKLGELRLAYSLPSSLTKKIFLQDATIALIGRDLFVWSNWPLFDPDASDIDGGTITPGIERAQFPSTRSFGLNINLKF